MKHCTVYLLASINITVHSPFHLGRLLYSTASRAKEYRRQRDKAMQVSRTHSVRRASMKNDQCLLLQEKQALKKDVDRSNHHLRSKLDLSEGELSKTKKQLHATTTPLMMRQLLDSKLFFKMSELHTIHTAFICISLAPAFPQPLTWTSNRSLLRPSEAHTEADRLETRHPPG